MNARRFGGLITAITLAGLIASGCSSAASPATSSSSGPEVKNIKVGVLPIIDNAAVYIAIHKGFFKAQGLNVTPVILANGALGTAGLLSGKLNFAFSNYVTAILGAAHGAKLVYVADGHEATPNNVDIVVPKGSPLRKPQDLRGKTIAVNAPNNIGPLLVWATLATYGVPKSAVKLLPVPFPQMAVALQNHSIDAAWITEPFLTEAEQKIGAQVLVDTASGPTANFPIAGYEATTQFVQQNPKTTAAFQRAINQAQALAANRSQVEQVLPTYIRGMTPQLAAVLNLGAFPTALSQARLQRVANLMQTEGMLQKPFDTHQLLAP
jgi:NitT/TauT family transport system substrate-binding protein